MATKLPAAPAPETAAADDLHRRSGAAQRQALECARLR